ncbi:hypothetical protein PAXRUDRAFT_528815, partial [Paxillus rubicundulus Ve08.2h10]
MGDRIVVRFDSLRHLTECYPILTKNEMTAIAAFHSIHLSAWWHRTSMVDVLHVHECCASCRPLLFVFIARSRPRHRQSGVFELVSQSLICVPKQDCRQISPAQLRAQYQLVVVQ